MGRKRSPAQGGGRSRSGASTSTPFTTFAATSAALLGEAPSGPPPSPWDATALQLLQRCLKKDLQTRQKAISGLIGHVKSLEERGDGEVGKVFLERWAEVFPRLALDEESWMQNGAAECMKEVVLKFRNAVKGVLGRCVPPWLGIEGRSGEASFDSAFSENEVTLRVLKRFQKDIEKYIREKVGSKEEGAILTGLRTARVLLKYVRDDAVIDFLCKSATLRDILERKARIGTEKNVNAKDGTSSSEKNVVKRAAVDRQKKTKDISAFKVAKKENFRGEGTERIYADVSATILALGSHLKDEGEDIALLQALGKLATKIIDRRRDGWTVLLRGKVARFVNVETVLKSIELSLQEGADISPDVSLAVLELCEDWLQAKRLLGALKERIVKRDCSVFELAAFLECCCFSATEGKRLWAPSFSAEHLATEYLARVLGLFLRGKVLKSERETEAHRKEHAVESEHNMFWALKGTEYFNSHLRSKACMNLGIPQCKCASRCEKPVCAKEFIPITSQAEFFFAKAIGSLEGEIAKNVTQIALDAFFEKSCGFSSLISTRRLATLIDVLKYHYPGVLIARGVAKKIRLLMNLEDMFVRMLSVLSFVHPTTPLVEEFPEIALWIVRNIIRIQQINFGHGDFEPPFLRADGNSPGARQNERDLGDGRAASVSTHHLKGSDTARDPRWLLYALAGKLFGILSYDSKERDKVYSILQSHALVLPRSMLAVFVNAHGSHRKMRSCCASDASPKSLWTPLCDPSLVEVVSDCLHHLEDRESVDFLVAAMTPEGGAELPTECRKTIARRLVVAVAEHTIPSSLVASLMAAITSSSYVSPPMSPDPELYHLYKSLILTVITRCFDKENGDTGDTSLEAVIRSYALSIDCKHVQDLTTEVLNEVSRLPKRYITGRLSARICKCFDNVSFKALLEAAMANCDAWETESNEHKTRSLKDFLAQAMMINGVSRCFGTLARTSDLRAFIFSYELMAAPQKTLLADGYICERNPRLSEEDATVKCLREMENYLGQNSNKALEVLNYAVRNALVKVLAPIFRISRTAAESAILRLSESLYQKGQPDNPNRVQLPSSVQEKIVKYAAREATVRLHHLLPLFLQALNYCESPSEQSDQSLRLAVKALESYHKHNDDDEGNEEGLSILSELMESLLRNFESIDTHLIVRFTSTTLSRFAQAASYSLRSQAVEKCQKLLEEGLPRADPFATLNLANELIDADRGPETVPLLELAFPRAVQFLLARARISSDRVCVDSTVIAAAKIVIASAERGVALSKECEIDDDPENPDSIFSLVWLLGNRANAVREAVRRIILARVKVALENQKQLTIPVAFRSILEGKSNYLLDVEDEQKGLLTAERVAIFSQRIYFSTWHLLMELITISLRGIDYLTQNVRVEKDMADVASVTDFRERALEYILHKGEVFQQSIVDEFFDHCLDVITSSPLDRRAAAASAEISLQELQERVDNISGTHGTKSDGKAPVYDENGEAREAGDAYASALYVVPAIARRWFEGLEDRELGHEMENFTRKHVSPSIINAEIEDVKGKYVSPAPGEAAGGAATGSVTEEGGELVVRGNALIREVNALYMYSEVSLEIGLQLPPSYPLKRIEVLAKSRVGMSEARWRKTILGMNILLSHKNGSLAEAIDLWRRNLDKQFEGVDECPICYSVLQLSSASLPKKACRTCKHRFHSECLLKWFRKSNSSTCPLCRTVL